MEFEEISLGDKVTLISQNVSDCVVIILDIKQKRVCLHHSQPIDGYHPSLLSSHVTNKWLPHQMKCIDNIVDYHSKLHTWVDVHEIMAGGQTIQAKKSNGCSCSCCGQFNNFAEPNQPDNTFKCYICREQPLRAYY